MAAFIVTFFVGLICIFLGISNRKGNISSLHSYHRHRVTEEDRLPFGKMVGLGTIIIGCGVSLMGVLSALAVYLDNNVYLTVGMIILAVGFAVGLGISFRAMIKYNKGIF